MFDGNKLRRKRLASRKLKTQRALARKLESFGVRVTPETISSWERGRSEPRVSQAEALSGVFRVGRTYFFSPAVVSAQTPGEGT